MLVIVMTLGEVLFNSRAVGRLGSLLFFFFGSLSYVPFLRKQASVRAAIQAITHQRDYLQTIFPYRGEAWGTWSQVTYLNQRHFASAIGILLLVLVFLVIRYRAVAARRAEARAATETMTAQPNELPDTAPLAASANPSGDVRESQIEMPSVSVPIQSTEETKITAEPFTTAHFFGCPSGFTADVEQRGVYGRCRDSRIVIHPVSAATSNAGASRYNRIDRNASDALFEHRKR